MCIIFQHMPIYRNTRGRYIATRGYEKYVTLHDHFNEPREYEPRRYIAYGRRYISSRVVFSNDFETELILFHKPLDKPESFLPGLQPLLNDYSNVFQLKSHYFFQAK